MTREELCIHACKYAIGELTRKGSSAFITSAHEGRQQISWIEVIEWLNKLEQEPKNKDLIQHIEAVQENLNNMVDGLNYDTDYYDATYHLEQIKKEVEQ